MLSNISICDITNNKFGIVTLFELFKRHSHFNPWMPGSHPKAMRRQLIYAVTENNRHSTSK